MKTKTINKKLAGAGILSAIAASLCCITPVLALIAGSSGIAASFSWLEPARPYLIGITIVVLGFAWYQKLKPRKVNEIECDCEENEKMHFMQTKLFLGIVTLFAVVMLAFPYYSAVFYPETKVNNEVLNKSLIQTVDFKIEGMTCTSCEEHIKYAVSQEEGFVEAEADYKNGTAKVTFDNSKTNIEKLAKAINATGYKVIRKE
ncbi:MAG: mercuric transport protein MerTP [Chlorobi bacterium]|nr:mercuric transport protein MerTP [Chlorobiota bacterium]